MSDSSNNNPFLALFSKPIGDVEPDTGSSFNELVENIFFFSLRPNVVKNGRKLMHLTELATALHPQLNFDHDTLEQAVLDHCIGLHEKVADFLFQCFKHSQDNENTKETEMILKTILRNIYFTFSQPDLFPDQDISQQWIDLFSYEIENNILTEFLKKLETFCEDNNEVSISELLLPMFTCLKLKLKKQKLLGNFSDLDTFHALCQNPSVAKSILNSSLLKEDLLGRDHENTLMGSLFTCSCIITNQQDKEAFNFFENPSKSPASVHSAMESNIGAAFERRNGKVQTIVYTLLKSSSEVHNLTRKWLGQVLSMNKARGQTWAQHDSGSLRANCVSDAFMVNLGAVLLKLCLPICAFNDSKALGRLAKVDPTYCATPSHTVGDEEGVHLLDMSKETCLIASNEEEEAAERRPFNGPFTFLTELFYLTHRALELGVKVVHNQMVQLTQELNRIERAYQDAHNQRAEVSQLIQQRMDQMMSTYLSYKATLLVPEWIKLNVQFMLASSRWLCSVALEIDPSETVSLQFPLKNQRVEKLSCIPEFCLSNVVDCVVFLRRFSPVTLEEAGDQLDHFLTLIIIFMGSPQRLKNPHLRAAMAEMLDSLMPHQERAGSHPSSNSSQLTFHRERLFRQHPYSKQVVGTLLHVFVSIEMTGQGVAFEQKFNYRRPMYAVMKFLWTLKTHRQQFKVLAVEGEANIDAAQPPLFLQFVNLLINDAIYLLDEALSYMAQLRELQQQRSEGSWPDVPAAQRNQRESSYQHITMLARFHNMMGRETIQILEMLTKEISAVFIHSTMVDRVASMLNYFLLHLVGPKKREFKVKDFRDYEFEPAALVSHICEIYCHLGSAEAFCSAVSLDGRSYSPQLFVQAEDVLSRIGRFSLIGDLQEVARRVALTASQQESDEELIAMAPEEFLDPIMSSIMMNPVILPSSKIVVDRATIARHLLSDQSDPFNRSPLTMEDIRPDEELRAKIQQWLQEKMANKKP